MGTLGPPVAVSARESDVVGRSRELSTIEAFFDDARRLPGAIALSGEAGIGKTTLWLRAIEVARGHGFRTMVARPAQSEARLAFSGLGDLMGEAYPAVAGALPEPQRRTLSAALLLTDEPSTTPDQRTVGVATLSALRELAEAQPVLVAIDDEQWLDSASASALGFALRRLRAEPIAVVMARRTGDAEVPSSRLDTRLPTEEMPLAGLSIGALHAVVVESLGVVLPRPQLRRLHEVSRGNPFLALELVRATQAGRFRLDTADPVSIRVERLVGARLEALPASTRLVLLAVAAASRPTVELLSEVTNTDAGQSLEPAVTAGIVDVSRSEVRFTHPLLAAAAYATPSGDERRGVHAALARTADDREERARHLALAATEADETVADEVERAAQTTFRRGAPATAADLAGMAVRMTPTDEEIAGRRRTAIHAEYLFEAGDTNSAAAVLEPLIAATPRGSERATLIALLARIRHFGDDVESGARLNAQALAEAGDDRRLEAGIHEGLAWGLFLTRTDLGRAARHARSAVKAAEQAGDDVALAEALAAEALTSMAIGTSSGSAMDRAIALEPALLGLRVLRHPTYARAYLLSCMDRLDEARALFNELLMRAEDHGDESAVPPILIQLAMAEMLAGAWDDAEQHINAGYELAVQTGQRPSQAALRSRLALLAAWRGRFGEARSLGIEALTIAGVEAEDAQGVERGLSRGGEIAAWALSVAALGGDRYAEALRYLEPLADRLLDAGMREPGELRFMGDTIEALIGLGRLDEADALTVQLEQIARQAERPTARAIAARSRALLAARRGDVPAALAAATLATELLTDAPLPLELARAQLVLGELLRRDQQKRAARQALTAATATFDALGAQGWAERAKSEMARIGGRAGSPTDLTPTESRVAELVSDGLANKEVAAALGIATKTVELHLSHVYAKLDVGSRTELVRQMARGKS